MTSLFLSYRRGDAGDTVGRLYEHLKPRLQRWQIFYDHKNLQPGSDFSDELRRQVSSATVVLVIIGPDWVTTLKERRGQAGTDHVFEEVRLALLSGNTVLPVLIRNATMPTEQDLDSFHELLPLLRKNALNVRPDPHFTSDFENLAGFLDETVHGVGPGLLLGGKYKLARSIGEGGMGVVYEAVDVTVKTSRARVAVKMILEGMNTREVLARFEGEKEALARMKHDHIARVLDSGVTPQGRPYFVMEYVDGEPITAFCDRKKLTTQERLRLFQKVCSAVQHAHTKGIVHRDLKPSNVLVEEIDGQAVPKVIDFGLAKALTGKLADKTLDTSYSRAVGTLLYMSPEQAAGRAQDIDTRTDVYSLGVLLYELLVGEPPFTEAELKKIGDQAVREAIIKSEPPKPSTKLSSSPARPTISANRQLDPAKLARLLQNELEWIPLKAMDKDPGRRYVTANQFSEDIEAYLNHERILAGKPTLWQTLQKNLYRNRGPVIASSLVIAALAIGLAVALWQKQRADANADLAQVNEARAKAEAQHAERQKNRAEAKEREAKQNELKAFEAAEVARQTLVELEKANQVLFDVFKDLDIRAIRDSDRPVEAVIAQRLIAAGRQLTPEKIPEPRLRAELQNRLGLTLTSLGYPAEAAELFAEAASFCKAVLGADHPNTLNSMTNLASSYYGAGQYDKALSLSEQILKLRERKFGQDHPDTLNTMQTLAASYLAIGKLKDARTLFESTLQLSKAKLGIDHPDTLNTMSNLATTYGKAGDFEQSLRMRQETLELQKNKLGLDHPDTLSSMHNLASDYRDTNQLEKAIRLWEETLKLRCTKLGPDHPDTLLTRNSLATGYFNTANWEKAIPLSQESLRFYAAKFGSDHPKTLRMMNNLASVFHSAGQLDKALPLFAETLKRRKSKLGPDHPDTLNSLMRLATALVDAERAEEAGLLFQEFADRRRKLAKPDDPGFADQLALVALQLLRGRQFKNAEALLRECQTIRLKNEPNEWTTFNTQSMLGSALFGQKQYADAEPLLVKGYEGMKAREKTIPSQGRGCILEAINRLIDLYTATNKSNEVKKYKKLREEYLPSPKEVAP